MRAEGHSFLWGYAAFIIIDNNNWAKYRHDFSHVQVCV